MTKKEVATEEKKELAMASQYEDDAKNGSGFEEADKDAYAIPFLTILQSGSPQCKQSEGAYIEGATEGKLFNTITEELFDVAFINGKSNEVTQIIPCHYKRSFIEWKQRGGEGGGGFVAEHSAADGADLMRQTTKNEKNQDVLANGNLLVDTRTHYVLAADANGNFRPVVMSFSSTQMKKSRRWMTVMQNIKMKRGDGSSFTPAMFSHSFQLTTVPESNDKGSWMGWKISAGSLVEDANLYNEAKAFREAILAGDVKTQQPVDGQAEKPEEAF